MLLSFLPSAALALYQAITLTDPLRSAKLDGVIGYGAKVEWARARGAATNALTFAGQASIALLASLSLALHDRELRLPLRLFAIAVSVVAVGALWLSTSRSYLLAVMAVGIGLVCVRGVRTALGVWVAVLMSVAMLVSWAPYLPRLQRFMFSAPITLEPLPDDRLDPFYAGNPSDSRYIIRIETSEVRILLWRESLLLIAQRPWLGHGPDGGWVAALESRQLAIWQIFRPQPGVMLPERNHLAWRNSQNMALQAVGETGFVGLCISGGWVVLVLFAVIRSGPADRPLCLAAVGVWLTFAVASLVENSFTDLELRMVWLLLLGLLLSTRHQSLPDRSEDRAVDAAT